MTKVMAKVMIKVRIPPTNGVWDEINVRQQWGHNNALYNVRVSTHIFL